MPVKVPNLRKSDLPKLLRGEHSVGHVRGLKLFVRGDTNKQWLFRSKCRACNQMHKISLGPYPDLAWEDAIANAMRARLLVDEGECLKKRKEGEGRKVKNRTEQSITVIEALEQFWPEIEKRLGDGKRNQWRTTLEHYVIPQIGNESILSLRPRDLYETFTRSLISADGKEVANFWLDMPPTAKRTLGRVRELLGKAIAYYEIPVANPAVMDNGLGALLPKQQHLVKHHKALDWEEVRGFWRALSPVNHQSGKVLKLLVLTGKRVSEVTSMEWSELDLEKKLWTIPWQKLRKKRDKEDHQEPLSDLALEILQSQPDDARWVFPNSVGKPLTDTAIRNVHRAHWHGSRIDTHGFRATIKTFFTDNDQLGFSKQHTEMILTHGQGELEAAYQRGTGLRRRREMMQKWADYLTSKSDV